ncbi:seipin-2-like isoform X2 [Durio zibethinus]|uniref:Seipin-2-like isoform X2 n=1 Tax=Durio zibethinus TaxID=66656 RepID=A0A6P5WYJ5_DURZI|nr:seipin-2-like isoform X2 [Durio zibethinus]
MESQTTDEGDRFFVALDDFPFYDCLTFDQSDPSTSDLTPTLRRRGISSEEPGDSLPEASTLKDHSVTSYRESRYKIFRDLEANDDTFEITESTRGGFNSTRVIEEIDVESTVTTARNDELIHRARNSADAGAELNESLYSSSSLLVFIVGLVIAVIRLQLNLLISFITLPLSVFSWNLIITKYHKSIWNLIFRLGWGALWATYVGCVLCGLLFTSLVISGVLMRYLVEEPLEIKGTLNFDYTKSSPVAFVPIVSCAGVGCGVKGMEKIDVGKNTRSRVIPPDHKLQVTVSLTLPESDYNRNLGMFQVRVDFLSFNGEALATSSHTCMLKFKKAQTLNLKIRGLNEGIVPTACLRVVLEQRAEYRPGAGIPELYDASLILKSELPFIKRIIWYWQRTIFIWVSITSFIMQLLFTLVCCRPILIPRTRTRHGSANSRYA